MKVLYVSAWYPHRYDAMFGLFVQKHALAVAAAGVDVCALYLHSDTSIQHIEITDSTRDGVREIIVYYPQRYLSALRRGWNYVRTHWGLPDVCQLNVITKNALLPLWLKWRYKTPYIIVEHWSGYLPKNGSFAGSSRLHRWLCRKAVRHAERVLTVSPQLAAGMQACGLQHPKFEHINNVVDDFFFEEKEVPRAKKKALLHVSCFDEQAKNVCGLLRAIKQVAAKRQDFTLTLIGTGVDYEAVRSFAEGLDLPKGMVVFTGELAPKEVAEKMAVSDALVLFSNYETAGVVLCESIVCGKPVISTPVGVAPLIVNEQTGLLVPVGDENALAQAINKILDNFADYDSRLIRSYGKQYSFATVGSGLKEIYQSCMDSSVHINKK